MTPPRGGERRLPPRGGRRPGPGQGHGQGRAGPPPRPAHAQAEGPPAEGEQAAMARLQIKMDNGPERRGKRTQFLQRMVAWGDAMGQPIQLLSSPPYHSKYNPIERCWGILARPWNGTKLVDVETMIAWAKSMTWKGLHPIVALSRKVDQKGVALNKRAMQVVEARLARHPELPKWDILILPAAI